MWLWFWFGPHPGLKALNWWSSGVHYRVLGIKPKSALCKESSVLSVILLLLPREHFLNKDHFYKLNFSLPSQCGCPNPQCLLFGHREHGGYFTFGWSHVGGTPRLELVSLKETEKHSPFLSHFSSLLLPFSLAPVLSFELRERNPGRGPSPESDSAPSWIRRNGSICISHSCLFAHIKAGWN